MPEKPHILVVDDDREIREPLQQYLRTHGFRVSVAGNGVAADEILGTASIDLVVLDIMMPGESGLDIARRLAADGDVPVILLSALSEETDRIVGIEIGADDYLGKPFSPRELIARIRSVLRRTQALPKRNQGVGGIARFDRWTFDVSRPELVDQTGATTELSPAEWRLLSVLVRYPDVTLSRDQLLDLTKGKEARAFDRSIDNQVSRLRRKIEVDPASPNILLTKWGGGYIFAADVEWVTA